MPLGESPRHFQETGDNNALWRSSTTDATLLQVFKRHVYKEAQVHSLGKYSCGG